MDPRDKPQRTNGSQPAIDWEEARLYFLGLSPSERKYDAVAKRFGVSRRTVETHARLDRWRERAREIEREAAERAQESLVTDRVERLEKIQQLIDKSLLGYEQRLKDGMRMTPADLERLHRLFRVLLDEVDEAAGAQASAEARPPERTVAHAHAVITALGEAGALEKLGLTYTPVTAQPDQEGAAG